MPVPRAQPSDYRAAPTRVHVCSSVAVGSPAARAYCPLTNPSDQPLCFEVIVQAAGRARLSPASVEAEGGAAGSVRIDHGDEELQLLKHFHLCQFVEEEKRQPREAEAEREGGSEEATSDAAKARLGGAVAIKLLLQPRARLAVSALVRGRNG